MVWAERQMLGTTASNQGWTVPSDADAPLRAFLDIHNMLPAADKSTADAKSSLTSVEGSAEGGAPVGYELRQANAPSTRPSPWSADAQPQTDPAYMERLEAVLRAGPSG